MRLKRCIMGKKRLIPLCALAVLLIFALLLPLFPRRATLPQPGSRLLAAAEGLNVYDLSLRLDAEERTLAVSERITFRNGTAETLDSVVLRVWLNAYADEESSPAALEEIYDACYPEGFSPGGLTLYDVQWNGAETAHAYLDEARTALSLSIPPLAPGETGEIFLRCTAKLPVCAHRAGVTGDLWQLGQVIPILSVWQDGAWRQDPYAPIGDPFLSECADYRVELRLPEGYMPACTAYLTREEPGVWRGEALAVRELGLCVSPSYQTKSAMQGNTLVTVYTLPGQDGSRALRYARQALETFNSLYGEYPYPNYAVCCGRFPFGGMEYPALCVVGEDYFADGKQDSLELVIAHETAHQWFYGLVGSDQYFQPWQDEALCEYAALRYAKARYGAGSYETLKFLRVDAPMRERIPGSLTPGSPIDYFSSLNDYAAVVYGRGAALLLALDEMLPGGADGFLRAYAERFAFRLVSREDFEVFLNEYGGMDLKPLVTDYLDTLMQ